MTARVATASRSGSQNWLVGVAEHDRQRGGGLPGECFASGRSGGPKLSGVMVHRLRAPQAVRSTVSGSQLRALQVSAWIR
jgi:hypothetical protein